MHFQQPMGSQTPKSFVTATVTTVSVPQNNSEERKAISNGDSISVTEVAAQNSEGMVAIDG